MTASASTTTSTTPTHANGSVRVIGLLVAIVGALMLVAGAITWTVVQSQLAAEKITVSDDAARFAGQDVNGPFTAYAEAEVIEKHALEASKGRTYAELDREDPVRATVMNGSFLRASLFTSVLAFGVSAMAMGLGVLQILIGLALRRLASQRA
jgi:hypothetical protein